MGNGVDIDFEVRRKLKSKSDVLEVVHKVGWLGDVTLKVHSRQDLDQADQN